MRVSVVHLCTAALFAWAAARPVYADGQVPAVPNRFEKNVAAYEAADQATPPPPGGVLLVGDSQFYRWKTLADDLPGYTIVNRGIDSFTMTDVVYFADRLVRPYKPRLIVVHAGGNDVNTGRSAQQVLDDFRTFVQKVRETTAVGADRVFEHHARARDAGARPRCGGKQTARSRTTWRRMRASSTSISGTRCWRRMAGLARTSGSKIAFTRIMRGTSCGRASCARSWVRPIGSAGGLVNRPPELS